MIKNKFLLPLIALVMAATAALNVGAYSYSTTLKTTRQTDIATAIDAGGAAGKLEIGTTGMTTVLCTITLNYNPSGVASNGVLALSGFPKSCITGGNGTAAEARIRTSANVDVVTGLTVTATGGGGNIQIESTTVIPGISITLDHLTFTHP